MTSDQKLEASPYELISSPSKTINHYSQILSISDATIELNLVTMKRSFLLVINNVSLEGRGDQREASVDDAMSIDQMIRGFMNSNDSLKGMSLAIGQCSTCIVNSESSLDSVTLAQRLSKSLNLNRPVYVANNFQYPRDTVDSTEFMTKLYMKIFQFVKNNYKPTADDVKDGSDNQ